MRRLGLDIGTNSIGWCLTEDEARIVDLGARIFGDGREPPKSGSVGKPLAEGRRLARGARRRRDRYIGRRSAFLDALTRYGLMSPDAEEARLIADGRLEQWKDANGKLPSALPYALRARALSERLEPYEIGRALFHLNQRRGFKSNRTAERKDDNNKLGVIEAGKNALEAAMAKEGAATLGQFLARRLEKKLSVRVRMDSDNQAYDFYPQRNHILDEFKAIWAAQAVYHPKLLNDAAFAALWRIIEFQRPLKEQEVGLCLFAGRHGVPRDEPRLPKAHPLFQERRLYEEVNQLEITSPGESDRKLDIVQRNALVLELRHRRKVPFTTLAKRLKLLPGESFNKATETRTELLGDEVYAVFADKKRFGDAWKHLLPDRQWQIIERVAEEQDPDVLHAFLTGDCELDEEHAYAVARTSLPEGHGRIGNTATRRILAELQRDVITYSKAVELCGWHHSDERTGEPLEKLPYYGELLSREIPPGSFNPEHEKEPEKYWGKITNPTVHIGLRQLEKLVNAIIAVHGRPDQIVVELARELKLNEKDKEEHNKRIRSDTADAQRRSRTLSGVDANGHQTGESIAADTGANRALLKLWEELNPGNALDRRCPYCAEQIGVHQLFAGAAQIDHIIPYSRSMDDSASNKVVAHRNCNQIKGNMTPFERWGGDDVRWDRISAQVTRLHKAKQWRFGPDAMTRVEKDGGFLARQLTDTQYLSRLAGKYLRSLYPMKEDGRVYVIPGRMTAMLRRLWALNDVLDDSKFVDNKNSNAPKNRLDHRHHAIDAFVCATTTQSLLMNIAKAAGRAEDKHLDRLFEGLPEPWPGYLPELHDRLARVTVSHKADHGRQGQPSPERDVTTGKLHDDTAYGIVGELEPGKAPVVVKRVPFLSLESKDIAADDRIRDETLRSELRVATRGLSGKGFSDALLRFRRDHPVFKGIRHVRVLGESAGMPTLNVIPIRDKTGRAYKAYKGNANALYTVWELPDGKWVPDIVTMFDYHQKGFVQRRPHPAARKVLSLRQNDLIAIERDGGLRQIMRVQKYGQNGQIFLIEHNEAGNMSERNKNANDRFKMWGPAANSLKGLRARQVRIDPLGRVFDPGPR